MTMTEATEVDVSDVAAALAHFGFESAPYDWGAGEEIAAFDKLCGTLARHRISAITQAGASLTAAQKAGPVLVEALERANTLLTKAVGDIVALRFIAGIKTSADATAEYVEAVNAIDATIAAMKAKAGS